MAGRQGYPVEFQEEAVRLVEESGKSFKSVAADLGIGAETRRRWVRKAEQDGTGRMTCAEREELRRLRQEVKALRSEVQILREERDILKKRLRPSSPRSSSACGVRVD